MPPRIVVVPPTHAEIAEIAKRMAPAGFELIVSRPDRASLEQVLPGAEYIVCYPNVVSDDAFYKAKLATARFYFAKLLPETASTIRAARAGAKPMMDYDEALF